MKNIGQMMKQAQQMQAKMAELQESLEAVEISGGARGRAFCSPRVMTSTR